MTSASSRQGVPSSTDRIIADLTALLGEAQVLTNPADLAAYLVDWRGRYRSEAIAVVRPGSTEEVCKLVRLANQHDLVLVPQGGNTGLSGGAMVRSGNRHAVIVRLDRMNRIRAISPLGDAISVDAGCVLATVQQAAREAGRLFPLSLGAEGSCQIGGNISTNAGGTAALRYGTMRDLVLGLEVVLADGRVLDLMTALRKDSAGYELRHLFIGAEGTLGIITGAVLKLFPATGPRAVALATLDSIENVLALLSLARQRAGEAIGAFEVMNREQLQVIRESLPQVALPLPLDAPWFVLVELSGTAGDTDAASRLEALLGEALEQGLVSDGLVAGSEAQAGAFWKIRHSVSEASKIAGYVVSHDSVVPLSAQADFVRETEAGIRALRPDARVVMHGHIGDGNIHVLAIIPPVADEGERFRAVDAINAVVDEVTQRLGGSISAEHGIGYANMVRLSRVTPALELELMARTKAMLDPDNRFNPDKIFIMPGE